MTIWKFPLQLTDVQIIAMPKGAKILTAQEQQGVICLWAIVWPHAHALKERVQIEIYGTGNAITNDAGLQHLGTVQIETLVWHVFKRITAEEAIMEMVRL